MKYKFKCPACKKTFDVEISMKEYDKEKNNQKCPKCNGKMDRVIEWQGIATGSGGGWCGRSDGKAI